LAPEHINTNKEKKTMSEIASMYEVALRKDLRFPSTKGDLTLQQLWEAPLLNKSSDFSLNNIAKAINKKLKDVSEEDFVGSGRKKPEQTRLELQLDLVKRVIDVKQDEENRAKKRAENKQKRAKILEAMEVKEDSKLEGMSMAKLKQELAAIDDDDVDIL
jgi:hypothetical protein